METQNGLGRESLGQAGGWEEGGYVGMFFVMGEEDRRANKRANRRAEEKEEEQEERLETQNGPGRESPGQAGGGWEEECYVGIFFVAGEEDKRANKRANKRAEKKEEQEEERLETQNGLGRESPGQAGGWEEDRREDRREDLRWDFLCNG